MQDNTNNPPSQTCAILSCACVVIGLKLLVVALCVPWLIALSEHLFFGTRHFEESLEHLGVHGFLGEIYDATGIEAAVIRLIHWLDWPKNKPGNAPPVEVEEPPVTAIRSAEQVSAVCAPEPSKDLSSRSRTSNPLFKKPGDPASKPQR